MRRFVLMATLAGLLPAATVFAQGQPAAPAKPAPQAAPAMTTPPMAAKPMAAPDPNNCGTPDEPKACPPMPRHPLKHYRAHKKPSN